MTTGVLRTQTQLSRLPPCKGCNSTSGSQEEWYQLPTIKKLSRKLLLLLSLCSLLPISKSLSLQLPWWFGSIRRCPSNFWAKFTFRQKPLLVNELYSEVFEASCASFHTFCCRGSCHSKQAVSRVPTHLVTKQVSTGNWGRRDRTQRSYQHLSFSQV